jgi:hypothetical protein
MSLVTIWVFDKKNAALKDYGEFSAAEQRASICEGKEQSRHKNSNISAFRTTAH